VEIVVRAKHSKAVGALIGIAHQYLPRIHAKRAERSERDGRPGRIFEADDGRNATKSNSTGRSPTSRPKAVFGQQTKGAECLDRAEICRPPVKSG
jgi:hypothetical protein